MKSSRSYKKKKKGVKGAISYNTNDSIDRHAVEFQDSITAADLWAQSWHGKFGPEKTKALQVGRLLHCDAAPRLSIGNQVISNVTVHKHLGVLLRQDLKWSYHIHEVVSKATRKAGLLRFMMHNLNDSLTIKLFICYVRPTLEYASPLWHGTIAEDDALAMERIQAAVAGESCELLGTHRSLTSLRNLTGLPFDGGEKSPASAFCTSCWITVLNPVLPFSSRLCHRVLLTSKKRKPGNSFLVQPAPLSLILFSNFGSVEHFAIKYSNADRRTHLQK